jgi:putative ABC transport system permease protein
MRKPGPLAAFLIKNLCRLSLYEDMFAICRDFEVEYTHILNKRGRLRAFVWLLGNTGLAAGAYFFLTARWRLVMFKNYFKVAVRSLRRHPGFSLINVAGLTTGMAACLVMLMFVVSETSYEDFHVQKKRIYRVLAEWGTGGDARRFAAAMPGIAPDAPGEIPDVEYAGRIKNLPTAEVVTSSGQRFGEAEAYHVDPGIFNIFTWDLLAGNPATALAEPFSVVLSQSQAGKYFGNQDCLGKSLVINDHPYRITGILRDLPANTHISGELLISYATLTASGEYPDNPWNVWGDDHTYLLLAKTASPLAIQEKLNALLSRNAEPWFSERMSLSLQPLSQIHWDSSSRGDIGTKGSLLYVYVFLTASILVLLIACFNFMNLSSSRYLVRMKEVGVRQVVGARRTQLIHQFLVESMLVTSISALLGVYLFVLLKRSLYSVLNLEVVISAGQTAAMSGIVALMVLIVGILAGGYPALFLSRFRSVDILKTGGMGIKTRSYFRQVLVIVQYSISILLIVGALVFYLQIDFMKNSDLGFDKEDVVLMVLPYNSEEVQQKYPAWRDLLDKNPYILGVSGAYTVPGVNSQFRMSMRRPGAAEGEMISVQVLPGDYGYVQTMGLQLIAGRDFSRDFSRDAEDAVILNEQAAKSFQLENPIGETLQMTGNREKTIIGVVEDFHVQSLHHQINPMIITINPLMFGTLAVRLESANAAAALEYLEQTWKSVLPSQDFNYRYLKDAYFGFYRTEEMTRNLINIFTVLALFVSCLGLLGLASFVTSQRVKEIGIRKILGASSTRITLLLSTQFTKWVVVSNLVAWPVAYYLLRRWLENFAYRIELGVLPFLLAGGAAFITAVLTVSVRSIKAAQSDPVESLRYE